MPELACQPRPPRPWLVPFLLTVFFLIALGPFVSEFFSHHPDERYYTDGGLMMLRTGDWLTPRWEDGQLRFRKPILTYWLTAGSFQLLGIGTWQARLPFLILGALAVLLTAAMAYRLTARPEAAGIAAAVVASHIQWIFSATRAIPDAPLVLGLLLSAWGFLELLHRRHAHGPWPYLAYGGAGLAIASKGMLGLLFVAYSWLFALVYRPRQQLWKPLAHLPAIALGTLLAGGWFLAMFLLHGSGFFTDFWLDQIGRKIAGLSSAQPLWAPLLRVPLYFLFLLFNFLPWSILALEMLLRQGNTALPQDEPTRLRWHFILIWSALLCVIFGWGINPSVRYIVPLAPLGALVLADLLEQADIARVRRALSAWVILLSAALALVGLIGLIANLQIGRGDMALKTGLLALLIPAALVRALDRRASLGWLAGLLAVAVLAFFPLIYLATSAFVLPDSSQILWPSLRQILPQLNDPQPSVRVLFVGRPSLGCRLELQAGLPDILDRAMRWEQVEPQNLRHYAALILETKRLGGPEKLRQIQEELRQIHPAELSTRTIAGGPDWSDTPGLIRAFLTGNLAQFLADHRQEFSLILLQPLSSG